MRLVLVDEVRANLDSRLLDVPDQEETRLIESLDTVGNVCRIAGFGSRSSRLVGVA